MGLGGGMVRRPMGVSPVEWLSAARVRVIGTRPVFPLIASLSGRRWWILVAFGVAVQIVLRISGIVSQ